MFEEIAAPYAAANNQFLAGLLGGGFGTTYNPNYQNMLLARGLTRDPYTNAPLQPPQQQQQNLAAGLYNNDLQGQMLGQRAQQSFTQGGVTYNPNYYTNLRAQGFNTDPYTGRAL